jgi:hypothetical protein
MVEPDKPGKRAGIFDSQQTADLACATGFFTSADVFVFCLHDIIAAEKTIPAKNNIELLFNILSYR